MFQGPNSSREQFHIFHWYEKHGSPVSYYIMCSKLVFFKGLWRVNHKKWYLWRYRFLLCVIPTNMIESSFLNKNQGLDSQCMAIILMDLSPRPPAEISGLFFQKCFIWQFHTYVLCILILSLLNFPPTIVTPHNMYPSPLYILLQFLMTLWIQLVLISWTWTVY